MFRDDIIFISPAVIIALFQIKVVWAHLPHFDQNNSKVQGKYSQNMLDLFALGKSLVYALLALQLAFDIAPITNSPNVSVLLMVIGYISVLSGFGISICALKDLGTSWTSMLQYRIKKQQKLITSGIYKYIRHPIYLSVILELVGYELIVRSWLFVIFLIFSTAVFVYHIPKEENLLESYFKKSYKTYKTKTKKLIPDIY